MMTRHDLNRDRELSQALRRLDPAQPTRAEISALARRIVARATPLLDSRRRATVWWEYAAAWAHTLIPLGVATAVVAAACISWISTERTAQPPRTGERIALLRAATSASGPRELVDLVLGGSGTAREGTDVSGGEARR
jgi:hypothetical protein